MCLDASPVCCNFRNVPQHGSCSATDQLISVMIDVARLPVIAGLYRQGTDQSQAGDFVWNDADHARAADRLVQSFHTVHCPQPVAVGSCESKDRQPFRERPLQPGGERGRSLGVLLYPEREQRVGVDLA